MKKILLTLTLCAAVNAVHAHYIWLEQDASGPARAYFGEWENDKREKAGGTLDKIKSPHAYLGSGKESLKIERRSDHLAIDSTGAGDIVLVEAGLAPRDDKKAGGKTKTIFHAKAGRSGTQARLDLELVPVAANANQFTLMLRGAPLAKTQVTVFGPPKWEKSFRTDEQGRVTIATPWAGRYVIEVTHAEEVPGESGGEKYDRLRHVSSLSFVVNDGIAWAAQR
ncbi:MAG: hypothetical protein A3I66_13400 [Burkholderiales bacterium RIFCSPLOWO2_02_FULL_57_36]|nr:MAG: hypothetical protein A3I66_13400 [Burkholderiales bacterium RIFCSPLOWO2_02_FULL_57_36]